MANSPKQPPLSNADDPVHNFDGMAQKGVRANEWLPFDAAQANLRGDHCFEFLIREKRVKGRECDYDLPGLQKRRVFGSKLKGPSKPRRWRHYGVARGGPYWNDQLVFVAVTQPIEHDKGVGVVSEVPIGLSSIVPAIK
jgi:hypothetical protein